MPGRGKILVVRGGAIGDFILTLPVLAALRRRFPDTRLEVLGYPRIAALALAGGLVDAVRPIEARQLAPFFAPEVELPEEMKTYFHGCDVIVSYLYDPDRVFQTNVGRCSGAQFIAGPHRPDEKLDLHATQSLLQPLERLTIFDAETTPVLSLAAASGAGSNRPRSNRIALHPGSGSVSKNWPESKWRDLILQLVDETGHHFLLAGGEAEGDRLERLSGLVPAQRLQLARDLPLPELARLLADCDLFVGHDSGITHLAAALGRPCLVLWGHSLEKVWRPQGPSVHILRHRQGLLGISVEETMEKVRAIL